MFLDEPPTDSAHGVIFPPRWEWLARAEPEDVRDAELEIVDAHHHLWDRTNYTYLFHEYLRDAQSGHNVRDSIIVESGVMRRAYGDPLLAPVGETEFAAGIGAMADSGDYGATRVGRGFVAFADLTSERVAEVLDAHQSTANGRFVGVRQSGTRSFDERIAAAVPARDKLYASDDFQRGVAEVARRGLPVDASVFHPQLADVLDLARAVPQATIVIDHAGCPIGYGPYGQGGKDTFTEWREFMSDLAAEPNTVVKLGGLAGRAAVFDVLALDRPLTSAELARAWAPYLETTIELFGAGRCMFVSNFPVERNATTFRVLWNAFKLIASGASDDERSLLFSGTARLTYSIPPTDPPAALVAQKDHL